MLRFEEEEQSNASKHPRPLSETADAQPVRFAPTTPPAARFLSRERNRGKSAAGLRPCTPVRQALKRRGQRLDDKQAGAGRESAISDGAAGNARLLFRVPFPAPEQGLFPGEAGVYVAPFVRFFRCVSLVPRPSPPVPRKEDPMGETAVRFLPWPGGGAPGNHSEGSTGAFSFPGFFLSHKKKSGRRRHTPGRGPAGEALFVTLPPSPHRRYIP